MASLFVEPPAAGRAMDAVAPARRSRTRSGSGRCSPATSGRSATRGPSLQWRDGFFLHTHEAIDPGEARPLAPAMAERAVGARRRCPAWSPSRPWRSPRSRSTSRRSARPSRSWSPRTIGRAWRTSGWPSRGSCSAGTRSPRSSPASTPGRSSTSSPGRGFPMVAALGWKDQPGAADLAGPLDNALRTLLALYALDPKRRPPPTSASRPGPSARPG